MVKRYEAASGRGASLFAFCECVCHENGLVLGEEQAQGWCDAKSLIAVETIFSRDNDPEHKVSSQLRY